MNKLLSKYRIKKMYYIESFGFFETKVKYIVEKRSLLFFWDEVFADKDLDSVYEMIDKLKSRPKSSYLYQ